MRSDMLTFADKVIHFNQQLVFKKKLPRGIQIMNPFKENKEIIPITEAFYRKFYSDNKQRKFIMGINPGRLGAGATGIPFTDTKRLETICNIKIASFQTHEPSSVFVYDVIEKYGGAEKFYGDFYIHSICPLGFTEFNKKGNRVNCNYYDYDDLFNCVKGFMVSSLKRQIAFGIDRRVCYVLGKRNAMYFAKINAEEKLFDSMIVLEHPRFIIQYKLKEKEKYIAEYLRQLE